MFKGSKIYIFIGCFLVLLILNPYMKKTEELLINSGYHDDKEGMTQTTLLFRIAGMKKVGTSFIWLDQVLTVGSNEEPEATIKIIKENSDKMSYLDPYFLTNYNFSGSILGLIRIYKRFDLASKIYQKGIKYNPNSDVLKNYYAGIVASSKNNTENLLENFEKVVDQTRDDLLTSIVAFLYEKEYKKTGNKKDLEKSLKYWKILSESKELEYREIGNRKLKEKK